MPNVEIFVVSCAKHFPWLEYCLKSIEKYCTGFSGVTVLVPDKDTAAVIILAKEACPNTVVNFHHCGAERDEWPEKGMLWHMAQIMRSDEWCPDADYILHTDSDCVFHEPTCPEDFFDQGKPILCHESFVSLGRKHPEVLRWQQVTQNCVTFKVTQELMRRHPAVHHRKVYAKARAEIETKTKMPCDDYIKSGHNAFPQLFCEFVTLGNIAMRYFPHDYRFVDLERQPEPPRKIVQFWSHSPPHIPQKPIYKGEPFECTPDYFVK